MDAVPFPGSKPLRKHRIYRKSRHGCRNCKLRRVKCDEIKPQCRKCKDYGVLCNFDLSLSDLQVSAPSLPCPRVGSHNQLDVRLAPAPPVRYLFISLDQHSSFEVDARCIATLERFRDRTLPNLFNAKMAEAWNTALLPITLANPFLMHTVLALTATHDRYMSTPACRRRSVSEAYHWSQCVILFNQKLSRPIERQDYDALWSAASLLGIIAFSSFDAASPEECWPLSVPQSSDLEWLRLSEGKMIIWNLTDPIRPGGAFQRMAVEYAQVHSPIPSRGVDGIPPALANVCKIGPFSTAENNSYFGAAHTVSRLRKLYIQEVNIIPALRFMAHLQPSFRTLLREKDAVALLLVALWYERAQLAIWWMEWRAQMECKAICRYLRRFHSNCVSILELLPDLSD